MAKRYGYPIGFVAVTSLLLCVALHANGGMIFFSSRDEFESQFAGGLDRFNFNSFASDTPLPVGFGNALNFGAFSVSQSSLGNSFFDAAPFETVIVDDVVMDADIDDTPYANLFLNATTSVDFVFSTPALGFGGDFRGFSGAINFTVFTLGQDASISRAINFQSPFIGVVSTDPISRIQFEYSGGRAGSANFAFDNAAASTVPEPASLLLWGIGATLLGGYGCARWRKQKRSQPVSEPKPV